MSVDPDFLQHCTRRWYNAGLTLVQCLEHWANVMSSQTLSVFCGQDKVGDSAVLISWASTFWPTLSVRTPSQQTQDIEPMLIQPLLRWNIYVSIICRQKFFFQFKIIINVSVSSFRSIWIPMLCVYSHYNYLIFSVRWSSLDVSIWRL